MRLYRILSDTLVELFPSFIERGGVVYTNAEAEEIALANDWYPLVESGKPTITDGQLLIRHYRVEGGSIILEWRVITPDPTPIDPP